MTKQWDKEKAIEKLNVMLLKHEQKAIVWWDARREADKDTWEILENHRGLIIQYVKELINKVEKEQI